MDYTYTSATNEVLVATKTEMEDKIDINIENTVKSDLENFGIDTFFKEVEEIRKNINDIQKDVEYFEYMYSTFLSSKPTDDDIRENIMSLISNLKKKFHETLTKLKEIGEIYDQINPSHKPSANFRIRRLQQLTLSRSLIDVIEKHVRIQQEYLAINNVRALEQLENAGKIMSKEDLEEALEIGKLPMITHEMIMYTIQYLKTLASIEQRHADILRLKSAIKDTSEFLTESQSLGEQYSEMEDTVAYQIEKNEEHYHQFEDKHDCIIKTNESESVHEPRRCHKIFSVCCCISAVIFIIVGAIFLSLTISKMMISRTPLL